MPNGIATYSKQAGVGDRSGRGFGRTEARPYVVPCEVLAGYDVLPLIRYD